MKSPVSQQQIENIFRAKALGGRAELMRGTFEQNDKYCGKESDIEAYGDKPKSQKACAQAGREHWERVIALARAGDIETIREEDPATYFHHIRTIEYHRTRAGKKPPALDKLCNEWVWGKAGTGKTLQFKLLYPDAYRKDQNKWWCAYNEEQDVVIIEDLDKKKAQDYMGSYLKIWADYDAFLAESKGGNTRYIRPRKIIVTSNWNPREIWVEEQMIEPIERRFKVREEKGERVEDWIREIKEKNKK